MRIELEYPFTEKYKAGYLRKHKKNERIYIDLVASKTDRTTMSYARYKMCIKEGRILTEDEHADHIDTDKTNDNYSNLQVLTIAEHKAKTRIERLGRTMVSLECPVCGISFEREKRQVKPGSTPKCSRQCNGTASRQQQTDNNHVDTAAIKKLAAKGMSGYAIAKKLNISANTARKYM